MSEDGRRVFKMETALKVIANQEGDDVLEFLGFVISRPVCGCCRAGVAPIVKGWLYSQNPSFMKLPFAEAESFDTWAHLMKGQLGENVSLTAMPAAEVAGIHSMMDAVQAAFQTAEEKTEATEAAEAATAAAQAEIKALAPFKAKAEELEKKVAQLEEKNKGLAADVSAAKAEADAFKGKVAINENEIEKSVKDIISKAIGSMSFAAGAVGAAAGEESAVADAPADFGGSTDSAGAVPDTFGFGASAPSDDGFGF